MNTLALSDEILLTIDKPARYIGNELNMVKKNPKDVDIRFAMCFPDVYEIGMSHLGIQILYDMFNKRDDVYCERVYSPWPDLHKIMKEKNIPLFALESQEPIKNFDFLGITIQYEMCYTNILQILDLSQIAMLSSERKEDEPIVIGGGPCSYNPEPIADFFDLFYIGEGEISYTELFTLYKQCRKEKVSRKEFLRRAASIPGIYVPSMYEVAYKEDGTIASFTPKYEDVPATVKKQIQMDMSHSVYPEKPVVPFIKATQDRVVLEIQRGCIRGCRFCQAGYIYRPLRERKPERLLGIAENLLACSGYDEISLSSLSTSDFSGLRDLTDGLLKITEEKKIGLSLPSLRIDNFSLELMEKVQKVRKTGITFAPEAGTQRLRDVINKNINEEDIINSTNMLFRGGWTNVKLYFMIGLPTETMDDVCGIADLAQKVLEVYFAIPKEERAKQINITVSTSSFVPKPFTAFQWAKQDTRDMLIEKQNTLKSAIKSKRIRYNWHDNKTSYLEGVFARGDRRLSEVIIKAVENGCKFDGWGEHFKFDVWMQTFDELGIDPNFYTARERSYEEVLPWDHIDIGVTKNFLMRENEKAKQSVTTPNCRQKCAGCGVKSFGTGVCYE